MSQQTNSPKNASAASGPADGGKGTKPYFDRSMTDRVFVQLVNRVSQAGAKYQELLKKAEAEYELRYGSNPSDCDDDVWSDDLHINPGGVDITLDRIVGSAFDHAPIGRPEEAVEQD